MGDTRLGFVGAGFVGGAMIRAFSGWNPCTAYDKGKNVGDLRVTVENSDVLFLSLPTPQMDSGRCDHSILDEVLGQIDDILDESDRWMPVVVRSTVTPGWFEEAQSDVDHIELFYMPEFLTARTADLDFIMSSRFILGMEDPNDHSDSADRIQGVFAERFPGTRFERMTWEGASLVKYATNCFFTVKISFFNELAQICKAHGEEPEEIIAEVMNDGRIGRSHFQVPGPDGKPGWGGACFPKDSAEWEFGFGKGHNSMVRAARAVNRRVRNGE